jgi:hypothetical protein
MVRQAEKLMESALGPIAVEVLQRNEMARWVKPVQLASDEQVLLQAEKELLAEGRDRECRSELISPLEATEPNLTLALIRGARLSVGHRLNVAGLHRAGKAGVPCKLR